MPSNQKAEQGNKRGELGQVPNLGRKSPFLFRNQVIRQVAINVKPQHGGHRGEAEQLRRPPLPGPHNLPNRDNQCQCPPEPEGIRGSLALNHGSPPTSDLFASDFSISESQPSPSPLRLPSSVFCLLSLAHRISAFQLSAFQRFRVSAFPPLSSVLCLLSSVSCPPDFSISAFSVSAFPPLPPGRPGGQRNVQRSTTWKKSHAATRAKQTPQIAINRLKGLSPFGSA